MTKRIDSDRPPVPVVPETPSERREPPVPTVSPEPEAGVRALAEQSRPSGPMVTSPSGRGRLTPMALATAGHGNRETTTGFDFASDFTIDEVVANPARARAFTDRYVAAEAPFFQIARDPHTGLTYDGINLDPVTGDVVEIRPHSAPSKECLDIGILIKALRGDAKAATLLGARGGVESRAGAAQILGKKLASYWRFYQDNPGYGGFLPWFVQPGGTVSPTSDWVGDLPGLDNGEWLWTLLTVEKVLRDEGFDDLAHGYQEFNALLAKNAVRMFFDADAGKVRGDVRIDDPSAVDSAVHTIHDEPGRATYLTGEHGVHEGMMMVLYVTLFGDGLADGAADEIWRGIDIERVEHPHGTTWQAYWGSAHESWAFLFLPFCDLAEWRQLFRTREEIRTHNAAERGYPGFGTSTNQPGPDGWTGYLSASGVEGIGTQPVENNHVYAIYGAFPLLLEHAGRAVGNVGLAWLLNMLRAPRAQGPWGAGESVTNDGAAISPCKTIDGSFPNLLAMMGGVADETAAMMRERGVYQQFIARIAEKLRAGFGSAPLREPSGFALPTTRAGTAGPAYPTDAERRPDLRDLYDVPLRGPFNAAGPSD